MNISISERARNFSVRHPKLSQWLWFAGLWCAGVATVSILAYPLKLLMKNI